MAFPRAWKPLPLSRIFCSTYMALIFCLLFGGDAWRPAVDPKHPPGFVEARFLVQRPPLRFGMLSWPSEERVKDAAVPRSTERIDRDDRAEIVQTRTAPNGTVSQTFAFAGRANLKLSTGDIELHQWPSVYNGENSCVALRAETFMLLDSKGEMHVLAPIGTIIRDR